MVILKPLARGIGMFAALLISGLLMKTFGAPLIDALPATTVASDWPQVALRWLGTSDAIFWFVLVGVAIYFLYAVRGGYLELATRATIAAPLGLGIIGGLVYRLLHLTQSVGDWWMDPALWIIGGGLIAPLVLWLLWRFAPWILELVFDWFESRASARSPNAANVAVSGAIQGAKVAARVADSN